MLKQQWVLFLLQRLYNVFDSPIAPIAWPRCIYEAQTHRHKFCVWASSIFFLTRWIWPRADKRKKEADATFVLLSAIRTHCSFYIFEYTRSPNLTKFRSFLPWKLPCIIFFRLKFGENLLVRKSWAELTCPVCKEEGARSSVKEVKYELWRGDWTRFN
jgi:hypothetical protein